MNDVNRDGARRLSGHRVITGVIAAAVLTVAACSGGDDDATASQSEATTTQASTVTTAAPTTEPAPATTAAPTTAPPTTAPPTSPSTTAPSTTAPPTTAPATTAPETSVPTDGSGTPPPTTGPGGVTYPTAPDGSPVPILGIYNGPRVTLSGVVPSEEAKARVEALALANSKDPNATLTSDLTIDATVPPSVGVRVLEMDSVRFPENSASIMPDHAAELDRAVAVLEAIPNATVLVIGHSDQRGTDEQNFAISEERAKAVANHLVGGGIDPVRVSSRAVGEFDLLTIADDEASLALNRRTEFVFYGLLIP